MNNLNHQLLQTSFEYPQQGENDYESLEPSRGFSSHPTFENEGSAAAVFRPDAYDPLTHSPFHPISLRTTNGFDYRTHLANQGRQEVPFQAGSGISMSPLTSSHGSSSASSMSAASSFAYVQKSFHPNSNVPCHRGSYPTPASSIYSPTSLYAQSYSQHRVEARPRLSAIARQSASGMPPPSRSSTNPISASPSLGTNLRENYSHLVTHQSRHNLSHHSGTHTMSTSPRSPMSATSRSFEPAAQRESPSSSHSFNLPASSMQLDAASQYPLGVPGVPPFDPTKPYYSVFDERGSSVIVDIQAKIDKGFFMAEADWTCYRRNYFTVLCCYGLRPDMDLNSRPIFLVRNSSTRERILSFSVLIVAKVDGEDGKSVELVQHTPKRDKGPTTAPELTELAPHPSGNTGIYPLSSSFSTSPQLTSDFESFSAGAPQNQSVATFDRIQFKKATANNGKRRAAQQYFHIVVELHAKVSRPKSTSATEIVKIAHRVSAPMVVRGRSPGHYSDERRGSMGPGSGSGAEYGSGQGDLGSAGPSGDPHGSRGGGSYSSSAHLSGGGYQPHQMSMAHSPPASHSIGSSISSSICNTRNAFGEQRSNPGLTAEEAAKFDSFEGYQYYPSTLFEIAANVESYRSGFPLVRDPLFKHSGITPDSVVGLATTSSDDPAGYYASRPKAKPEQSCDTIMGHNSALRLYGVHPSSLVSNGINSVLRYCRPFQGMDTSKGFYPAMPAL